MELSARGLLTVDDPGLAEIGSVSQDTLVHGGVVARAEGQGEMVADDWPETPPWGMARRKGEGASAMVVWELLFSADGKKNKKRFPPALLPAFLFVSLSSGRVDKERVEARVCE